MTTLIERAFELAPECATMKELRKRLADEGFDRLDAYLGGLGTRRQLRARFNQGQGGRPTGPRSGNTSPAGCGLDGRQAGPFASAANPLSDAN